jgi:hypothetical protein
LNGTRPCENASLLSDEIIAADARRSQVFSHRSVHCVEFFDRSGMLVLLDAGDEALEGVD